jgi:transcriptional regulator with XRE-family HTH domain
MVPPHEGEIIGMPRSKAAATRRPPGPTQRQRRRNDLSPRKPTAIDKHVGKRLRLLRQINEVSLEKLAELVDVAPQQIQKYEIGETRMSASRIFELSKIFGVPLIWFYDDLEAATSAEMCARIRRHQSGVNVTQKSTSEASQEALLVTYYAQLTPEMRQKLIDIARMLSELAVKRAR